MSITSLLCPDRAPLAAVPDRRNGSPGVRATCAPRARRLPHDPPRDGGIREAVVAVVPAALRARAYEHVTYTFVACLAQVAPADVRRCFPTKAGMVLAALQAPHGPTAGSGGARTVGRRDRDPPPRVLGDGRQHGHSAQRVFRRRPRTSVWRRPSKPTRSPP